MTLQKFKETAASLRRQILGVEESLRNFKDDIAKAVGTPVDDPPPGSDKGEAIANCMLAYRHLEDARMRLGKAIQAADGGTSVYDK